MNSVATMIAKLTPNRRPISDILLFPQVNEDPMRLKCHNPVFYGHPQRTRHLRPQTRRAGKH